GGGTLIAFGGAKADPSIENRDGTTHVRIFDLNPAGVPSAAALQNVGPLVHAQAFQQGALLFGADPTAGALWSFGGYSRILSFVPQPALELEKLAFSAAGPASAPLASALIGTPELGFGLVTAGNSALLLGGSNADVSNPALTRAIQFAIVTGLSPTTFN